MTTHTIDLRFQGYESAIGAFLVEGSEGFVLVETGPESTRETLVEALSGLGVAPGELAAVFVTHIHLDHAGAAGWFAAKGVPVHVHPKGAKHLVDPSRLVESSREVYGDAFDELWGELVPGPEDRVVAVEDGETVAAAGLEFRAVATPGHAFHHHAWEVGDTVFAGDAAGARLPGSDFISVTSAPTQFHEGYTLESIGKLRALGKPNLVLTHFGAVPDPDAHLAAYAEAVELNVTFVRQRLAEGMDGEALQVAYQAFQMEQAFRLETPREVWDTLHSINGPAMCADGIRISLERESADRT